jgi:hypothetical protein
MVASKRCMKRTGHGLDGDRIFVTHVIGDREDL